MSNYENVTNRSVTDENFQDALVLAKGLQSPMEQWPDESIWKREAELVRAIANKLTEHELAYLLAYSERADEDNARLRFIERSLQKDGEECDDNELLW